MVYLICLSSAPGNWADISGDKIKICMHYSQTVTSLGFLKVSLFYYSQLQKWYIMPIMLLKYSETPYQIRKLCLKHLDMYRCFPDSSYWYHSLNYLVILVYNATEIELHLFQVLSTQRCILFYVLLDVALLYFFCLFCSNLNL